MNIVENEILYEYIKSLIRKNNRLNSKYNYLLNNCKIKTSSSTTGFVPLSTTGFVPPPPPPQNINVNTGFFGKKSSKSKKDIQEEKKTIIAKLKEKYTDDNTFEQKKKELLQILDYKFKVDDILVNIINKPAQEQISIQLKCKNDINDYLNYNKKTINELISLLDQATEENKKICISVILSNKLTSFIMKEIGSTIPITTKKEVIDYEQKFDELKNIDQKLYDQLNYDINFAVNQYIKDEYITNQKTNVATKIENPKKKEIIFQIKKKLADIKIKKTDDLHTIDIAKIIGAKGDIASSGWQPIKDIVKTWNNLINKKQSGGSQDPYYQKYLKYKLKYLNLRKQFN
jgi:septum formation topological specificity factor MinE